MSFKTAARNMVSPILTKVAILTGLGLGAAGCSQQMIDDHFPQQPIPSADTGMGTPVIDTPLFKVYGWEQGGTYYAGNPYRSRGMVIPDINGPDGFGVRNNHRSPTRRYDENGNSGSRGPGVN